MTRVEKIILAAALVIGVSFGARHLGFAQNMTPSPGPGSQFNASIESYNADFPVTVAASHGLLDGRLAHGRGQSERRACHGGNRNLDDLHPYLAGCQKRRAELRCHRTYSGGGLAVDYRGKHNGFNLDVAHNHGFDRLGRGLRGAALTCVTRAIWRG